MKYETRKLTALTRAINAIQGTKVIGTPADHLGSEFTEVGTARMQTGSK